MSLSLSVSMRSVHALSHSVSMRPSMRPWSQETVEMLLDGVVDSGLLSLQHFGGGGTLFRRRR